MSGRPKKDYSYLIGNKYNKLTVLGIDTETGKALCRCECGNETYVWVQNVGRQKSCGCIKIETALTNLKPKVIHGETGSRLFRIWDGMRRRCYEQTNKDYPRYGGRGIEVYSEWRKSYIEFSNWARNNGYSENLTLDRIDVNGNYCPENCRWADCITQCNNRRNNHKITYNGETHTIAEWSRITGIPPKTLLHRVKNGWSTEDALTLQVTKSNSNMKSRYKTAG